MKKFGRFMMLALVIGTVVYAGSATAGKSLTIFKDVAKQAGVDDKGHGKGVILNDYDKDGYQDIFVSNKGGHNVLYKNNHDGTFSDVTEKAGVAGADYSIAVAVGDYDNDGYPDIYVVNVGRSILYHNRGNGTFEDVTDRAGVAAFSAILSIRTETSAGVDEWDMRKRTRRGKIDSLSPAITGIGVGTKRDRTSRNAFPAADA